jgi:hypothetical protein
MKAVSNDRTPKAKPVQAENDRYGRRYVVDFMMKGRAGIATIRSHWIIRLGENIPRLTTCYVL